MKYYEEESLRFQYRYDLLCMQHINNEVITAVGISKLYLVSKSNKTQRGKLTIYNLRHLNFLMKMKHKENTIIFIDNIILNICKVKLYIVMYKYSFQMHMLYSLNGRFLLTMDSK
jgi:hypothetical protein